MRAIGEEKIGRTWMCVEKSDVFEAKLNGNVRRIQRVEVALKGETGGGECVDRSTRSYLCIFEYLFVDSIDQLISTSDDETTRIETDHRTRLIVVNPLLREKEVDRLHVDVQIEIFDVSNVVIQEELQTMPNVHVHRINLLSQSEREKMEREFSSPEGPLPDQMAMNTGIEVTEQGVHRRLDEWKRSRGRVQSEKGTAS